MDQAILLLHLAQAEDHVALGASHIARQRELAAALERDGHNPGPARELLALFEELQNLHLASRDTLLLELGGSAE
jgi:hypothetical protein